jgi:hemerythrin
MSLKWRPEMSTGLDWQDEDHQKIFNRIDQLLDAMQHHSGNTLVKEMLLFLGDYARGHFKREEDYMLAHHCRNYELHKNSHDEFVGHLTEIMELYDRQGASTVVVMRLQGWLREWLINHIMNMDKRMVPRQIH